MDKQEKILRIKKENPSFGYKKISKIVSCSPNTVKYHLSNKEKMRAAKYYKQYIKINPLCRKISHFREIREKKKAFDKIINNRKFKASSKFTTKDLLKKIGENPKCYLSGLKIDLNDVSNYEFDHIIPVSIGGDNSLENLGLCNKDINRAKHNKTPEEFIKLCKLVLENQGFKVTK